LNDSEEKIQWATEALREAQYADSIYHSYSAFINTAKALLLSRDIKPSTQIQTLLDFQKEFVQSGAIPFPMDFKEFVLRINKNEPTEEFAISYLEDSKKFLTDVLVFRGEKETVEK
jgi:sulfite reductase (ferredoxin)